MPSKNTSGNTHTTTSSSKKKKGHAPAHQNKFAFSHNPKSKTTAKILASPNVHVCRRCQDKIEWRKQYRKYKPRTQPGTCNGCHKRNVKAAYHTICESCTRTSVKAKAVIAAAAAAEGDNKVSKGLSNTSDGHQQLEEEEEETLTSIIYSSVGPKPRACAVCVKELALPDPEEDGEGDVLDKLGKMKLREKKAIERQLEREAKEAKEARKKEQQEEDQEQAILDDSRDENSKDTLKSKLCMVEEEIHDGHYEHTQSSKKDDEDDPFLRAIGGQSKALTGAAYQESILSQNQ